MVEAAQSPTFASELIDGEQRWCIFTKTAGDLAACAKSGCCTVKIHVTDGTTIWFANVKCDDAVVWDLPNAVAVLRGKLRFCFCRRLCSTARLVSCLLRCAFRSPPPEHTKQNKTKHRVDHDGGRRGKRHRQSFAGLQRWFSAGSPRAVV